MTCISFFSYWLWLRSFYDLLFFLFWSLSFVECSYTLSSYKAIFAHIDGCWFWWQLRKCLSRELVWCIHRMCRFRECLHRRVYAFEILQTLRNHWNIKLNGKIASFFFVGYRCCLQNWCNPNLKLDLLKFLNSQIPKFYRIKKKLKNNNNT